MPHPTNVTLQVDYYVYDLPEAIDRHSWRMLETGTDVRDVLSRLMSDEQWEFITRLTRFTIDDLRALRLALYRAYAPSVTRHRKHHHADTRRLLRRHT